MSSAGTQVADDAARSPRGRSREARAGLLVALATLAMAGASGVQAVLYLSRFGTNQRTDAFFAAFALYTVFGIFTQSVRLTSVPALVGATRRLTERRFGLALALIGLPVAIVCGPLAGPLAHALAPGVGDAARALTRDGLHILGGAMVLQLAAAGVATLLAIEDRFEAVSAGYAAGAGAGLVVFLAVERAAGELSLGWSMLAMGIVTCLWLAAARLRRGRPPGAGGEADGGAGVRRAFGDAGGVLGRTLVYFVINGLYLITLAFASRAAHGDATILSYAYLYASYLVAGTSVAVGISRVPDMTRGAQDDWADVVADTVPHGFRYAMLVCAPALAGLIAAGAELGGRLLPHSLPGGDPARLRTFAALLAVWTVGALVVNFALPALFALGRARLVNLLALPLIALHVGATVAGYELLGVNGVVGACFIAPLAFGVLLVALGAGQRRRAVAREIVGDALRFSLLAAAAFGAAAALGLLVPAGIGRPAVVAVVGAGLYAAGVRLAAANEVAVLLGGRRPAGGA